MAQAELEIESEILGKQRLSLAKSLYEGVAEIVGEQEVEGRGRSLAFTFPNRRYTKWSDNFNSQQYDFAALYQRTETGVRPWFFKQNSLDKEVRIDFDQDRATKLRITDSHYRQPGWEWTEPKPRTRDNSMVVGDESCQLYSSATLQYEFNLGNSPVLDVVFRGRKSSNIHLGEMIDGGCVSLIVCTFGVPAIYVVGTGYLLSKFFQEQAEQTDALWLAGSLAVPTLFGYLPRRMSRGRYNFLLDQNTFQRDKKAREELIGPLFEPTMTHETYLKLLSEAIGLVPNLNTSPGKA